MILDFHTHAFPDALAGRALRTLSHDGGGLVPVTDGTAAGLATLMQKNNARGVLLPVATNPEKLRSINEWALMQASERVIPFGAVHPFSEDAEEALDFIAANGMKGVKLHPEYQGFALDDPRAVALYRQIARRGLITVFHMGGDVAYLPPWRATPELLLKVLPAFDGAPVVAAHMGGYLCWEQTLEILCGLPVYLDTAYCHSHIIKPLMQQIIDRHGTDRILFGSDVPWANPAHELALIASLALEDADREKILHANGERLLGFS